MELARVHALLIDLDGVLYRGQAPLPGASELFDFLRERDIDYLLVTNNSTLTREAFVERLAGFDIQVTPDEIMTSAVATAAYLRTLAPEGTKVNVVGESGLVHELERFGFVMAGRDAEYVVAGWDKTVTYEKLRVATLAVRDGATFVGTNPDKTYPMENDIIPGAGSILAALVAATDVEPIIVGKPEPIIIQRCLDLTGSAPAETAILGDRLDTDILGGQRAGIGTILVLTGISTRDEAEVWTPRPGLVVSDLTDLLQRWDAALG
ncbi:MAG: HAD-IIA family hydrolase [Anaerolineae bacterium]|jgi:4-nitrophenyl phosphatase